MAPAARPDAPALYLASASRSRAELLRRAGVEARIEPALVDEDEVKAALRAEGAEAGRVAETLAEMKATRVSRRHAGALVIGADQMLSCGGAWFDKAKDRAGARRQLDALRGKKHELVSAVCVARDGARVWHHRERAELWMRDFSDRFAGGYLDAAGADALDTVGCYRLEGLGVQLFSRIDGDFFTVLGLPLLPLLDFLRGQGVVAA